MNRLVFEVRRTNSNSLVMFLTSLMLVNLIIHLEQRCVCPSIQASDGYLKHQSVCSPIRMQLRPSCAFG